MRARVTVLAAVTAAVVMIWIVLGSGATEAGPPPPPSITLRIATQMPNGTVWMDALADVQKDVKEESRGRVELQYFAGGTQGDEKAVLERMGVGILHGGLFSGIGLGEALPELLVLELPFVYRDRAELEAVRAALEADFGARLERRGLVLLGWADFGEGHIFSKVEARSLDELRRRKIAIAPDHKLAEPVLGVLGLTGVPLPLTDVAASLESGAVDAILVTTQTLVGLQWHGHVRYRSGLPLGPTTGALIVSKAEWEKIPAPVRAKLAPIIRRRLDRLPTEVAAKDEQVTADLRGKGLTVLGVSEDEASQYAQLGDRIADQMVGVLYDKELLERVRAVLAERRKSPAGGR